MSSHYRHYLHSSSGQGTGLPKAFWNIYKLFFLGTGLFFLGIAVLCFGAGGLNFAQEEAFFAKAERTTGTITAYELYVRNDGLSEYCPRIEYTTKAGEPFAYQGSDCPNAPDSSKIGQQVQLYYDPKNPKDHRTKGFGDEYTGLTVGVIGGVFSLGLGVFLIVIGWGTAALSRLITPDQAAAQTARDQRYAAASAASEAATDARIRESLLAGGASEAEAEAQLQEKRRAVEQWKAKRERKKTEAESPADAEARLAQLKQQEAELQRKIDEQRQQGQ